MEKVVLWSRPLFWSGIAVCAFGFISGVCLALAGRPDGVIICGLIALAGAIAAVMGTGGES